MQFRKDNEQDIPLDMVIEAIKSNSIPSYNEEEQYLDVIGGELAKLDTSADTGLLNICRLLATSSQYSPYFIATLGAMFIVTDKKVLLLELAKLEREGLQYIPSSPLMIAINKGNNIGGVCNLIKNRMQSSATQGYNFSAIINLAHLINKEPTDHFSYVGTCMYVLPRLTLLDTVLGDANESDIRVLWNNDTKGIYKKLSVLDEQGQSHAQPQQHALMMVVIYALVLLSRKTQVNALYEEQKAKFDPANFKLYKELSSLPLSNLIALPHDASAHICFVWKACVELESFGEIKDKKLILQHNLILDAITLLALRGVRDFEGKSMIEMVRDHPETLHATQVQRILDCAFQYYGAQEALVSSELVSIVKGYPEHYDAFLKILIQWLPVQKFLEIVGKLEEEHIVASLKREWSWMDDVICRISQKNTDTCYEDIKAAIIFCAKNSHLNHLHNILIYIPRDQKHKIADDIASYGNYASLQLVADCGIFRKEDKLLTAMSVCVNKEGTAQLYKQLPRCPSMETVYALHNMISESPGRFEKHVEAECTIYMHQYFVRLSCYNGSPCHSFIKVDKALDSILQKCHSFAADKRGTKRGREEETHMTRMSS